MSFDLVFKQRTEPNGKTLAQVIAAFRAEPERADQINKLRQTCDSAFSLAGELFGTDRPIREIDRDECKAFRTIVQVLPPNATKRFPDKSLSDAAKLNASETDRIRSVTINYYTDSPATLFNYAEDEGWITQNPSKKLAIKGVKKRHGRDPFAHRAPLIRIWGNTAVLSGGNSVEAKLWSRSRKALQELHQTCSRSPDTAATPAPANPCPLFGQSKHGFE